jgi:hypothetical protein
MLTGPFLDLLSHLIDKHLRQSLQLILYNRHCGSVWCMNCEDLVFLVKILYLQRHKLNINYYRNASEVVLKVAMALETTKDIAAGAAGGVAQVLIGT